MNYKKIYTDIINRAQSRDLAVYSEKHHIIPRCLGGTDDDTNLVKLTPEEHYICHQLLVKIYPGNHKLLSAALFMTANGMGKRSNKVYGWLKRRYSEYMRGTNNPQKLNPRSGERHHTHNRKIEFNFSEAGRKVLSDKVSGVKNPNAGIKPWNHPRATDYTRSVWKKADELYTVWQTNNQPSYCKLYTLVNKQCYTSDSKVISPYMNMIKYFNNGWVPSQDPDWNNFK